MEIKYLLAFGISLVATLVVMPLLIPFLHKVRFGQSIRKEGPQNHMARTGTPTMGGLVFVSVSILVMLALDYKAFFSGEMLIHVLAHLGYVLIEFIDDLLIVVEKNSDGLKPSVKFLMQSVSTVVSYLFHRFIAETMLILSVVHTSLELGILYPVLIFFTFICESNTVNLTNSLDGLCAGTSIIAIAPLVIFALLQGNKDLAMPLLAVRGSLLGYLRFNAYPAKTFMGDTSSLAIGGLFAVSTMTLKQELLPVVIGGIFIMELPSVVIQVTSYKAIEKRVFRMAPLHHHFELGGIKETQVASTFWSIGVVLATLGLWLGVM